MLESIQVSGLWSLGSLRYQAWGLELWAPGGFGLEERLRALRKLGIGPQRFQTIVWGVGVL